MLRGADSKEEVHQIYVEHFDPVTKVLHVSYQDVQPDDPRLLAQIKQEKRRRKQMAYQWRSSCLRCSCHYVHQIADDFAAFWNSQDIVSHA